MQLLYCWHGSDIIANLGDFRGTAGLYNLFCSFCKLKKFTKEVEEEKHPLFQSAPFICPETPRWRLEEHFKDNEPQFRDDGESHKIFFSPFLFVTWYLQKTEERFYLIPPCCCTPILYCILLARFCCSLETGFQGKWQAVGGRGRQRESTLPTSFMCWGASLPSSCTLPFHIYGMCIGLWKNRIQ